MYCDLCGNYSREENIQGRKLYEEIRYTYSILLMYTVLFLNDKLAMKNNLVSNDIEKKKLGNKNAIRYRNL